MCFVVWFVICALVAPVAAQQADALRKAQSSFDQAQIDYLAGKYDEAAKGFQEAYGARQFPQFLYNIGACFHMKGKRDSNVDSYAQAVEYYRKYIEADPNATDKAKVEKAIGVLTDEIKRLKEAAQAKPAGQPAPPAAPSAEVQSLGDAKPRSLVVVESEPQGATVYLDDKKNGSIGTTPWSGSIEGTHKVIIEKRGYMQSESEVTGEPNKLFVLRAVLGKQDFLGWVQVTSNVPGAVVFIDDKSVGAVAKTPHSQNIKPGKHTLWVTAEGYDETVFEVDIAPGETKELRANLKGEPVGRINVLGFGIEDAKIYLDGKLACDRGPCMKTLPQGEHTLRVERGGMKSFERKVAIQARAETTVKVTLVSKPGRGDAVVAFIMAGAFGAGGAYLGREANKLRDELRQQIDRGDPPVDSRDDRFQKGKIYAIAADATFVIAGITAVTAIYYTFRDKGPPSSGLIDVRSFALSPQVGPGYAGLGMGVSF
ncbi:MAG TPA: PEGA domain-containing protein [Kofleriaceae bacterium]|nr:PEGA domain-containing protein [Kofleriaceae bacterium]